MPTISQLLTQYKTQLNESRSGEILLAHVLKQSRAYLYTYPEKTPTLDEIKQCDALIAQRAQGMPIAYLLGEKEFYSLNFKISTDTLIPRPETELLIEQALQCINIPNAKILELGTGSGTIAVTLAHLRPQWQITACDISADALAIATENAKQIGCQNLNFILSDWYTQIPTQAFHLVISNPPYIAANDPHLAQGDLRFEPNRALVGGVTGLECLEIIIKNAPEYVLPEGWIVLEHGFDQALQVQALLKQAGFQAVESISDLSGMPRMSMGQKPA